MHPLSKPLRSRLEATVKAARDIAETAARSALEHLGVGEPKASAHLTPEQAELRRRLRLHGRQLGDVKHVGDKQDIRHLVWEVAYEHWHRMLFARFLAENNLLMHPDGVAVSLADCNELAKDEGAADGWELAGRYAARMLPQVFRMDAPALQLRLAPEHQRELAKLVSGLDVDTFRASDSLGWVYQFWQAKRKDEVNASEVKIGADELPAVTQLFTEPYMVAFLLHNSLGAWWQTRHPGKACPVDLDYLRTLEDGTPAAGKFEGWPDGLKEFKLLDPCCGSGHFIVAAFHLLVPMRMQAERLSAADAVDAVIADNLHGLEIDPRCVEIAAFALALAAWSYPHAGGYRVLPILNIACCGLKVSAKADDWAALVPDDAPHATLLRQDLKLLHASMREAPLLGSLLDPWRSLRNDLATSDYAGLQAMLSTALTQERADLLSDSEDLWDAAVSAQGLLDAARILAQRYHLVITNVPYLARGRQSEHLKDFCATHYPDAKNDLANVFLERNLELALDGKGKHDGIYRTIEGASSEVHVTFETQLGVTDTVVIRPHANEHRIEGREVIDLKTVLDQLQVQIFSQGELSRLTKPGHNQVLRLVNAASNDELLPLVHEETSLKSELEHLAVAGHRAKAVEAEVSRITQELQELTRQWQARKDVQGEAQAHQRARQAIGFVQDAIKAADADAKSLAELATSIGSQQIRLDGEQAAEWPHPEWFMKFDEAIEAARSELAADVKKAKEKFNATVLKLFSEASDWPAIKAELQSMQDGFLQACQEKGLQPADVTRLQEVDKQRVVKQTDLETKRKQLDELKKQVSSRADKLAALHAIWRKQFEVRKRACEAIQAGSHTTVIDIEYMRDKASFDAAWERLDPKDNRTRLGKNWADIGKALFAEHVAHSHIPSPWELIERWKGVPGEIPDDIHLQMYFDELVKHLESDDVRSTWENVRLTRVEDFIDVELRRYDGTSAGRMSGAGGKLLSEGQRNTALLNLMLAQGKGPIVIDQPEDELDSNYIFSDLVPLLREVKEKRQLILATHNANLPVNADAELIYAIEARDAQGKKRSEGGLDRAEVTQAVLDIMEGSEQAFKRRSEKYHF